MRSTPPTHDLLAFAELEPKLIEKHCRRRVFRFHVIARDLGRDAGENDPYGKTHKTN